MRNRQHRVKVVLVSEPATAQVMRWHVWESIRPIPAGCGVELFATTLHYAPMNVGDAGYRVACVLPRGTNYGKPSIAVLNDEDNMCAGSNKWLMAHKDSSEANNGSYIGLIGENITFDMLEI
ncbi:MAG: DUF4867 family protein [Clostridia bacterium]|nr:DUF4867 family protein [Clostridia bacterium]